MLGINGFTLNLIDMPFSAFANRADPDQAALVRAMFAYGNMIRYDPTQVDLTSKFFAVRTSVKVDLYNYS